MRFKINKKIISVVLAVVLLVSALVVGLNLMPTVAATENLLANASFETADKMWNSAAGKSGNAGYSNFKVGHGQSNLIADGWYGTNYHSAAVTYLNHTSDAYAGNYAVNINMPQGAGVLTIYPHTDTFDKASVKEGYYEFSAWIKSNNTSSSFELKTSDGKVYTAKVPQSNTWTKVSIDGIYLSSEVSLAALNSYAQKGVHIKLICTPDSEDSYITIDDFKLVKSENLLAGGDLESTGTLWNTKPGYTDKTVAHGQSNLLTDGWYGQNWWANTSNTAVRTKVDHSSDAVTGSYSLKFKLPAADASIRFYPKADSLNKAEITEGYYTFSVWVKSDSSVATNKVEIKTTDGSVYSAPILKSDKWQQITIDGIYLSETVTIATTTGYQHNGPHILISLVADKTKATNVFVDNFRLTRLGFLTDADFENGKLSAWKADSYETDATAELTSDASSGEYAVKLTLNSSDSKISLNEVSLPKEGFTEGYYMWAFDAKGKGKLTANAKHGNKSTEYIAEGLKDEWQRFVVKDIDLHKGVLTSLGFSAEGEGEIFIDNIEFYRQVGPGGLIDGLTVVQENDKLILPTAPEGYEITVLSSSNADILSLDGKLTSPESDTDIEIVLKITNVNDLTDTAKTEPFNVTIKPFTVTEEPADPEKPENPEEPEEPDEPDVPDNPPAEQAVNYFVNSSFENCETVWNSATSKYGPGYANKVVGHGQHNLLADGWRGHNWLKNSGKNNSVENNATHIKDAHSGEYALKFTLKTTGADYLNFYPNASTGIKTDEITSGNYKLTLWVKGTNTVSTITVTDGNGTETSAVINATGEWTQIVIDDIDLSSGLGKATVGSSEVPGIVIRLNRDKNSSVDTELYIDDICLEKIN